jgi:hypothetical protein|tara:strand:+ start:894 stop:1994 length:1101 start_codon:yes stop_codon:yes gene_type:complete
MNLIIGPSGAWYALGLEGLCGYIIVNVFTKLIVAEFSALNEKISRLGYRISPIFLISTGFLPLITSNWYTFVIIVPILLATYVGLFWTGFHGIRKLRTLKNERESVKTFQHYEIVSTLLAAFLVLFLKQVEMVSYAGYIGSILAFIALVIPMKIGEGTIRVSSSDMLNEDVILARLTTGSFGIIGFSTVWCMRIIALEYAGVSGIAGMVALSSLGGHIISNLNEKKQSPEAADSKNWIWGTNIVATGIFIMIGSLILNLEEFFLAGYLITRGGASGILHPLEVRISGELLIGDGNEIGLRERIKFRIQTKIMFFYLISNYMLYNLVGEINLVLLVLLPLVTSLSCCKLNFEIINNLKTHQRVQGLI